MPRAMLWWRFWHGPIDLRPASCPSKVCHGRLPRLPKTQQSP